MQNLSQKRFFITGTRRGLGQALAARYGTVDELASCDIVINCKHDGWNQIDLLYEAAALGKRIINIGSNSPDTTKKTPHRYQIEKHALDKANEQLFYTGINTTCIRFGWFDSPRVAGIEVPKLSLEYCVEVIEWVLRQPHRVKDLTIISSDLPQPKSVNNSISSVALNQIRQHSR